MTAAETLLGTLTLQGTVGGLQTTVGGLTTQVTGLTNTVSILCAPPLIGSAC